MADLTPNPDLRKKRLKFRILETQLGMERLDLRKAEIAEEVVKIDENLSLMQKSIDELTKEIGD